ncbi:MAG: DUF896 domain-containing protein [Fusobacteria bacterium]|nr:DUF896 domain-containing protein [Fusobacteriota bacterium]
MKIQELLAKINQLAKIAKERELTQEEKMEQQHLRKIYLDGFRSNLKSHLDSIKIIDNHENNVEKH